VDGLPFGKAVSATMVEGGVLSLLIDGKSYEIRRDQQSGQTEIRLGEESFLVEVRDPRSLRARRGAGAATDGPKKITAPMPGKVIRILAPEGTQVEAGQGVLVIEAMKMQNELKSPKAGIVKKIMAREGATVNPGDALAIVE
jgi:biotin carboxyl carrier protein